MTVGDFVPFRFPKMIDPDKEDLPSLLSIDYGGARPFISGTFPSFLLNPTSNLTDPGAYTLTVSLIDDNPSPQTQEY